MNKKILLISLLSIFMLTGVFANTLADDTTAYWTWNNTLTDKTGNGNTLSNTGTILTSSGKIGQAYNWDSSNDYQRTSNPIFKASTDNTISFWVNVSWDYTYSGVRRFYDRNGGDDYNMYLNNGQIAITAGGTMIASAIDPSSWWITDDFMHIVVAYQSGNTKLYVNGNLKETIATAYTQTTDSGITVGNREELTLQSITGVIDEMAVFNTYLNEGNVSLLYNKGDGLQYPYKIDNLSIQTNLTNGEYFRNNNISIEVNTSVKSDAIFYHLNNTNYIVEDGLVSYYNFDGDYTDSKGSNNGTNSGTVLNQAELTGTITGATFTTKSKVGNYAMSFDGINDKIDSGLNLENNQSFTFIAWVNHTGNFISSNEGSVISNFKTSAPQDGLELQIENNGNSLNVKGAITGSYPYTITANTWNLIAVTFDGTSLILYHNGNSQNVSYTNTGLFKGTSNLQFGARPSGAHYNGSIDDTRIYDRALTPEEISDIYTSNDLANDVRQSNANRFNFEEGSGTTTLGQAIIPLDMQQVEFDGIDDYINLGSSIDYSTYAFSFWINKNDISGTENVFSSNEYLLRFEGNFIKYFPAVSSTGVSIFNTVPSGFGANQWHHFVLNYDETSGAYSLYMDNSLVTSGTNSQVKGAVGNLYLSGTSNFLDGSMDEVRIYDRALSSTEIELLYNESPYNKLCDDCNTTNVNLYNLTEGNYNISFLAIAEANIASLKQNFNIDLTNPVINDTLPSEINSYLLNISEYVTCVESNLKTCNITFTPDGNTVLVNQTSLYNFTYNGNQSYNIIAEDQAGNKVSESGTILVNPFAHFQFNNSGTLLNNYTFGGVLWANETAKFTLYNSILNMSANNTIEFNKVGYITQTFTQEVLNTSRINTSYNVAEAEIIVTIRDKDTLSQITGTNFTLSFIGNTGFTTTTITGNKTITGLLSAGDYELIVSSTPYTTESNFFTFSNQELLELTVYLANSSTNGFVIIEATGTSGELAVSAKVQALQWNGVNYIVVSEGTTDTSGKATLNVILKTKSYQFKLIEGTNSITSPAETITTDENGKTVPLSLQTGGITYNAIIDNYLINSTETYNNQTNISSILMDWNSRDGTDMVACINVYTLLNDVERLSNSFCSNASSSGQMNKNFLINSSQFTNIKTELLLSNSYYTYQSYKYTPTLSFQNALLTYGFYFFVMLILYLVSIWAGMTLFDNIYIALMLVIVSGFIGYSLVPSVITNLVATSFGLMGSLTIWAGYKKK